MAKFKKRLPTITEEPILGIPKGEARKTLEVGKGKFEPTLKTIPEEDAKKSDSKSLNKHGVFAKKPVSDENVPLNSRKRLGS